MKRMKAKKNNALPAIKEVLERATEPHCCYRMRNKLHKTYGMDFDGATIQHWLTELADAQEISRAEPGPDDEFETFTRLDSMTSTRPSAGPRRVVTGDWPEA